MSLPRKLTANIDGGRITLMDDHPDSPVDVAVIGGGPRYDRVGLARELALAWNAWMHFGEQDTAYSAARERALAEEAEDAAEGRL